MKPLSRLAATAVYTVALLGIWLLGGSKYDWMSDIDPAFADATFETHGSREVATAVLVVIALCATAFLARSGKERGNRVTPLILSLLAILVYVTSRA